MRLLLTYTNAEHISIKSPAESFGPPEKKSKRDCLHDEEDSAIPPESNVSPVIATVEENVVLIEHDNAIIMQNSTRVEDEVSEGGASPVAAIVSAEENDVIIEDDNDLTITRLQNRADVIASEAEGIKVRKFELKREAGKIFVFCKTCSTKLCIGEAHQGLNFVKEHLTVQSHQMNMEIAATRDSKILQSISKVFSTVERQYPSVFILQKKCDFSPKNRHLLKPSQKTEKELETNYVRDFIKKPMYIR